MSKYGTFPASPTPPEGSSAALDSTPSEKPPGEPSRRRRPWRELADPRALSVPRDLTDASRRARANLARFAANYGLVYLAVYTACVLWRRAMYMLVALPWLLRITSPGNLFPSLLILTPFLLLYTGAPPSVLVLLAAGLMLIAAHAVLHLPADGVDEEAGLCVVDEPEQPGVHKLN